MAIPAEPLPTTRFSLLVAEEDGRVLTVGDDAAPAVFSGEGEAELFLHLAAGGGGWRIRRTSPRELASLLCGPYCAGAQRVALDPSPEMFADELLLDLVSVDKHRFLERFAKRDRRGSGIPAASWSVLEGHGRGDPPRAVRTAGADEGRDTGPAACHPRPRSEPTRA